VDEVKMASGDAAPGALPHAMPPLATEAIIQAGRRMDARGWVPATAGNISVRLDASRIAITRSGGHKGFLDAGMVMQVDLHGQALTPGARPSAETLLHCQLYRLFPQVGAVVHGHSVAGTVLSMVQDGPIRLAGYEVLKVFEGQATHDAALDLPVFANDQDIGRLAGMTEPVLLAGSPLGYLIRGHGVYIWGPDMAVALARLEGLEFLLACELERRKLRS
jgi:methylthioribulose-1-phosphate dehydratase